MIKKFYFLLLLLPLTVTAETFKWNLPAKRLDGSALPLADIKKSTVKCSPTAGGPYTIVKDANGSAASLDAGFILSDGWKYCIVTTTGQNTSAGESAPSAELAFFVKGGKLVLEPLAPDAPANFRIE